MVSGPVKVGFESCTICYSLICIELLVERYMLFEKTISVNKLLNAHINSADFMQRRNAP